MLRIFALALVFFFVSQLQAAGPVDHQMDKDVRKLLELNGGQRMGEAMVDGFIAQEKKLHPDAPPEFWTEFAKIVNVGGLVERLVPIYAARFTNAEIQELIAFYESPIGRKYSGAQLAMSQEAMEAGKQWGADIGGKAAKLLANYGYSDK